MRQQESIFQGIDWVLAGLYLTLVIMGWLNIYAAVYNEDFSSIFDITQSYGKQLLWIFGALIIAGLILLVDGNSIKLIHEIIYIFSNNIPPHL